MYIEDTIAAIATPPGIGGVGIIRVSGKEAFSIVNSIFSSKNELPLIERENRTIQYGFIMDGDQKIDEVLLLLMKGPHSYTAEDIVEIQCHGGIMPVRKIMDLLFKKKVRLAEAGEFTRRAFLNGRIDLTQAEAIIDVIDAKSESALQLAMQQLGGGVSSVITEIREKLITLIASMEVAIDYPEEDIEDVTIEEVQAQLEPIEGMMKTMLQKAQSGRLIRDGIETAIIGLPNAGKSSLMNTLLRENRAIVTDIPGTTRDSIEEYMNIEGITLRLVDTAGIRETEDIVEKMGVEKARSYLDSADFILCVIDGSTTLTKEEKDILEIASGKPSIVFINKKDKGQLVLPEDIKAIGEYTAVESISAAEGEGIDILAKHIKELVYGGNMESDYSMTLGNMRHIHLMEEAFHQVHTAQDNIDFGMPIECVATDLREAWTLLGEITGESIRDDLTGELFSRFCLGK